ncbi:TatD family hydrolase [Tenacibaculum finnmarkense]|uniref:TatD family hydrolase n=1 Tax=Tenacibaculum finnmarkense TaxID=2781243 RepID=UPI001EFA60AE|nr:hydrolase TatD [Tenacibaculum finnmarkense]
MIFINIHTHTNSDENFSILNCYPNSTDFNTPFSIGIHPWFINKNTIEDELIFIKKKLLHKNCYAIGECGLDRLSEVNYTLQIAVFKEQINLSEEFKKPLIIHCVRSFQEIIQIKKELKPRQKWLIHGFHKNNQIATDLIKNGCFLSFGKALLYSEKLQEVFFTIPLDKIFLETDDAKIDIATVYEKASRIKNTSVKKIQENIHQNFNTLFIK